MLAAIILAASVPIVPTGQTFTCSATRVWDGDGPIWCAEGPRIRLHGIAAKEMDNTCRPGHPCPDASGVEARDHLVELLGGRRGVTREGHILVNAKLICVSYGSGKGTRTAATCMLPGVGDLSRAMIRDGYAARWNYR